MSTQPTSSSSQAQSATGPADELLDPQRHRLITRLLQILGEPHITSIGWACLWFADLEIIEQSLEDCERAPHYVSRFIATLMRNRMMLDMIQNWKAQSQSARDAGASSMDEDLDESCEASEETEIEEPPTKKRRRACPANVPRWNWEQEEECSAITSPASALCNERDKNACVVTGFREPLEIAHIYPYSLGQKSGTQLQLFWQALKSFWTPDRVDAWQKQVSGPDGTEICSNLMCMVKIAHKLWEKARFALKPLSLSEDQKVLKVAFYWLPRHVYSREMASVEAPSPFAHNLSSDDEHGVVLYDRVTKRIICSGDILTFETDDPVGHPLPSVELLNMQWILHRVLALSGVADATDEELDPDSDIWSGVDQEDSDWDSEEDM